MIKCVIFDIDNTLYSYDDAHAVAFKTLCEYAKANLHMTREEFRQKHKSLKHAIDVRMGQVAASHNRLIRYQNLLEEEGLPISLAPVMERVYWDALLEASVVSEGAGEVMKWIKEKGIRIGIGTDMTADIQFEKLEKLGLLDYVDFMVSSEEAGAEKPSPQLFDLCALKASCKREESLFVGDSLERDVKGANAAGMHGVFYDCKKTGCEEDVLMIRSFGELRGIVESF